MNERLSSRGNEYFANGVFKPSRKKEWRLMHPGSQLKEGERGVMVDCN